MAPARRRGGPRSPARVGDHARAPPATHRRDRQAVASRAMVDEPSNLAEAVADAVDPDEVITFTRSLIAARSENPGGTEDDAAEVAVSILRGLGADPTIVRSEAGRPSVVATIGDGGRPHLAWNGHLDVVPAGSPDTWTTDPWAGAIHDGRLVGRGSADMKGPIGAALAAAAALVRSGVEH